MTAPHAVSPSTAFTTPPRRWEREGSGTAGEEFVVHRGKTVPTLYNVGDGVAPRSRAAKEKLNTDTKAEERGEERGGMVGGSGPAGVPSNWEERKQQSFAGRRSRRNSISDDSHLTIENFGGSQDNISLLGRNPDKEPVALHVGRRPSGDSPMMDMPKAGTPSTPSVNVWRRNNERTRSQVCSVHGLSLWRGGFLSFTLFMGRFFF